MNHSPVPKLLFEKWWLYALLLILLLGQLNREGTAVFVNIRLAACGSSSPQRKSSGLKWSEQTLVHSLIINSGPGSRQILTIHSRTPSLSVSKSGNEWNETLPQPSWLHSSYPPDSWRHLGTQQYWPFQKESWHFLLVVIVPPPRAPSSSVIWDAILRRPIARNQLYFTEPLKNVHLYSYILYNNTWLVYISPGKPLWTW